MEKGTKRSGETPARLRSARPGAELLGQIGYEPSALIRSAALAESFEEHQKIFSWRRRFPTEPRLAMRNTTRYWFSLRMFPNENLRYSKPIPQHEPL